jgi:hypothetical protein
VAAEEALIAANLAPALRSDNLAKAFVRVANIREAVIVWLQDRRNGAYSLIVIQPLDRLFNDHIEQCGTGCNRVDRRAATRIPEPWNLSACVW